MAVDPYSPCPCGSGKKLKFCCNDLATDIEKIHKMISGEQPHAALKHVENLLQKQPQRSSLLDLRASIELSMHDFDSAQQTIATYLSAHPKNASAHAQQAILLAGTENPTAAVDALQTALEFLSDEMPLRTLEAIGAVGHALLLEGNIIAARAHLLLYAAIAPSDDNEAVELLLRMNLQADLPLLLREYLQFPDCPQDVTWRERYDEAARFSGRGLWRRAEASLAHLLNEVGTEPEIVYALALMRGWLGKMEEFSAGFHEYARLEVPFDNAIEAEALAQLVNPKLEDPQLETVKFVYTLEDAEEYSQQLSSDKRVEHYPLDYSQGEPDAATRPRSTHVLLDRPIPTTGVGIEREAVPNVIAFLSVYGKRTDREARLEVTTDRDDKLTIVQNVLSEIGKDALGPAIEEEVVAEKSISEDSLSWRWRLPDDTPSDLRRSLIAEERRQAILQRWTSAPRAALNNQSPQEVVGDADLHIPLVANALIIEQAMVDPAEAPLFVELREKLQLPESKTIDPEGVDLEQVPIVRIPRLDLQKLSTDDLAKLLDRTLLAGAHLASLLIAKALVEEAGDREDIDLSGAYRHLIRKEPNFEKARGWVQRARTWAENRNQSQAEWALLELELAIQQGDSETVRSSLSELQSKFADEPGIAEATYRMLYSAGLIPPTAPDGTSGPHTATAPAPKSGLWTPEDGTAGAPEAEDESNEKSVIWTP